MFLILIIYGSLISYYSMRFFDNFEDNWGSMMLYVNRNAFNVDTMGCYGGKYSKNLNSTDFYDLKCQTKSEIALIWEENINI